MAAECAAAELDRLLATCREALPPGDFALVQEQQGLLLEKRLVTPTSITLLSFEQLRAESLNAGAAAALKRAFPSAGVLKTGVECLALHCSTTSTTLLFVACCLQAPCAAYCLMRPLGKQALLAPPTPCRVQRACCVCTALPVQFALALGFAMELLVGNHHL